VIVPFAIGSHSADAPITRKQSLKMQTVWRSRPYSGLLGDSPHRRAVDLMHYQPIIQEPTIETHPVFRADCNAKLSKLLKQCFFS
jgi:hypothetical protein